MNVIINSFNGGGGNTSVPEDIGKTTVGIKSVRLEYRDSTGNNIPANIYVRAHISAGAMLLPRTTLEFENVGLACTVSGVYSSNIPAEHLYERAPFSVSNDTDEIVFISKDVVIDVEKSQHSDFVETEVEIMVDFPT